MLIPILALEAMLEAEGSLPINVKLLFEGAEEIGSPNLETLIRDERSRLACDLALSADGTQSSEERPSLLIGFKGLCAMQIDVKGPGMDLHSGIYGGAVQNPIHALTGILSSMRGTDGRILVDGFYDDVRPLTAEERTLIDEVPYDEVAFKNQLGVEELFGEPGYSTFERSWVRPTIEVNGIWGGFQGEGTKTVIPSEAHGKITCRLVPGQEPERILSVVKAHIEAHTPQGVRVNARPESAIATAYVMPADHPGNGAAHAVLEDLYGYPPYYTKLGGTLPVCSLLLDLLDVYTVIFAFGLEDENAHSPDEFFRLSSFERGQRGYCMLFEKLAEPGLLTMTSAGLRTGR